MLHLLKKLFKPKKVSSANDANVLVFAELYINPNSDVKVNFTYSDALPDNLIARSLFMLVLYQAANIRVNLITEHSSIQAAYQQIMVDIVSQWPEGGIAETGDFFTQLSFFKTMVQDNDFLGTVWAANDGETIELKLTQTPNNSLFLYDHYPGMQGYGPPGLAINLAFHFVFLVDFVLALLDGPTCDRMGQALSEFWLSYLQLPFDSPRQIDRSVLYKVVDGLLDHY